MAGASGGTINNHNITVNVPNGWSPKDSNNLASMIVNRIKSRGGDI
jgi:hypothetical protein